MIRILAVIAFIVAIILFAVAALGSTNPHIFDWGAVAAAAGLLCLALEGIPWGRVVQT